ncbi:MAG: riboflavin synthase [Candidatus Moranbacteria bacterium]|jgi:riboflavin synthase|nr:riboflavin synthase [Candidatus Moranbacteria bacterium]MDD5651883.1 riboflavin synthase [Candidatus Moranbacteria bacterium]MDX9855344.1 riboflavin synthase [Candidatus Moranbacteria bacterium]
MFTGIIKKVSIVEEVSFKKGSLFVEVKKPSGWKIWEGGSISINGVCSTVRRFDSKIFEVEYMPETIKKTTVGGFKKGTVVNLEKSLKMNDLLDGHLVQGHIDARGEIIEKKKVKESEIVKVRVLKKFMVFIAPKGSVSIDGISLTVVDAGADWFTVSLVSYTIENTNMHALKVGDEVNVETDVLAKYLYNFYKQRR